MNRVRNTAYSKRTLATDLGCCRLPRSKLLKAPLWGMRAGGSAVGRIINFNGASDCRQRQEPMHLSRGSMSPE